MAILCNTFSIRYVKCVCILLKSITLQVFSKDIGPDCALHLPYVQADYKMKSSNICPRQSLFHRHDTVFGAGTHSHNDNRSHEHMQIY